MSVDILIILLLLVVLVVQLWFHYRFSATESQHNELRAQMRQATRDEVHGLFNQLESMHFLRDRLNLREGMPYTTDWSAAPDFLKLIVEHCLEHKPKSIVECSSGLTTVMLARCCELNSLGHVYSLENGEEYAEKSRAHLRRYGLEERATVIHAPLQEYTLNNTEYQWYALKKLPDKSIDMLVIDGPPGFIQKHSRYPALALLGDKLSDGGVIFMDDAARDDEREIVAMWQSQFPMLKHRYVGTVRGCSLLTWHRGN